MRFNDHSKLEGAHAFLSPSSYSWVNYDEDKMDAHVMSYFAARRGTQFHELARKLIELGVKLPETTQTFNRYVNDCIGFRMTPEQRLFYSMYCHGTPDAICFRRNKLMVFDLKTGSTPCKFTQLEIYAALFCLEYRHKPANIEIELRIYQNDEVQIAIPDFHTIMQLMDRIVYFDKRIRQISEEVYG